jgi:hypothetical protein
MDPVLEQAQVRINGSGLSAYEKGQLLNKCVDNIQRAHVIKALPPDGLLDALRGMLPPGNIYF